MGFVLVADPKGRVMARRANGKEKRQIGINKWVEEVSLKIESSCHSCDKSFCCRSQTGISVTKKEARILKRYLPKEKYEQSVMENSITGRYTCPFLGDDGKCTVYQIRPLVCSSYLVASPKELCDSKVSHQLSFVSPSIFYKPLVEKYGMEDMDGVTDMLVAFSKAKNGK